MEQQPEEAFRFLESGDEAGTAPGDRKFRPDVEGLRAIAISVVLLLHFRVGHFLWGIHRCRRVLRHFGFRHNRTSAQRTRLGGEDVGDGFLCAA